MDAVRNRIQAVVELLEAQRFAHRTVVDGILVSDGDYEFQEWFDKEKLEWRPYGRDETWGGSDRHYWFLAKVRPEDGAAGREVRTVLNTGASDIWNTDNPQMLVYINGMLAGTMDMNHQNVILSDSYQAGTVYELAFYAYSNSSDNSNFFHLDVGEYCEDVASLYYDMKVPFEAADLLTEDRLERVEALKVLNRCAGLLDTRSLGTPAFRESVKAAAEYLRHHYYEKRRGAQVTVHSIGHTHIDVAWKWPLKQTRQKTVRSFQTVLNLMDRYPEYKFMSSQPQLYQYVKEAAPKLYERIKEKIREGRWEAEGAMWLEPDCNLASGESLVRHILYGRKFFEEEMGADPNEVLWLPDVFGYSAALPQIMRKSDLSYFMTTKLGWNEYNQFPYDTFMWKGIDGSEVLTYLITTRDYWTEGEKKKKSPFSTTYNGRQNASQIMGTWQRYQNKDVSRDVLTCYGYGDGGGGPTEEMLEQSRRLEYGVAECPRTRQTFVKDFFHILEQNIDKDRLPSWNGELYLEYHRGTYTSMAQNKKYNRRCEFLLGDAEFYSVLAELLGGNYEYPADELENSWKLLLLNQFHDILPGSSIRQVYEDSTVQYEEVTASCQRIIHKAKSVISDNTEGCGGTAGKGIMVWNSLSFPRSGIVSIEGDIVCDAGLSQKAADGSRIYLVSEVPAKGYRIYAGQMEHQADGDVFEEVRTGSRGQISGIRTLYFDVDFDDAANIVRLYDRRERRSLLQPGQKGNQMLVYEDRPMEFDAWNIDPSYEERMWKFDGLLEFKVLENGPVRGSLYIKRSFENSVVLEQEICFYRHTGRIDFKTNVEWNAHQLLLKTAFPMDILCNEANYEIQFGNVKRPTHQNTSWDKARFEVCVHKWADISEAGYGVAMLNDCKYGMDIHDSVMRLTLIKSGIFPNPEADQGHHTFTYSLYPHQGDYRSARVVQDAYDLNCPLEADTVTGKMSSEYSFMKLSEENVIADTVKLSEDGKGVVLRFYEAHGKRTRVHAELPWAEHGTAAECDLMEQELEDAMDCEGTLEFEIKPFEIKTIKIVLGGRKDV